MSDDATRFAELDRLASAYCESIILPDDWARLEAILAACVEARRHFAQYVHLHAVAERFSDAPSVSIPLAKPARAKSPVISLLGRVTTAFNRPVVWSIVVVAMIFYGTFVAISWNLRSRNLQELMGTDAPVTIPASPHTGTLVAKLIRAANCTWRNNRAGLVVGVAVPAGTLQLLSGTAEFEFSTGTRMIVKGPALFAPQEAGRATLEQGKLTVHVPPKAIGFTITTPTANIVDLGTDFDVEVSDSGETDVHVVRGAVTVELPPSQRREPGRTKPQRLVAGQSTRIDMSGVGEIVATSSIKGRALKISAATINSLDLVDIVAGGDGRTHRRDRGIDPSSGRIVFVPDKDYSMFGALPGHGFQRVYDLPFVDGVGIPDASGEATQLTSAKHTFEGFPKNDGRCYGPVWAGGSVPERLGIPKFRSTFDGRLDLGNPPNGFIALIPNKLITFDLAAIRQAYPDRSLAEFRTVIGMTKSEGMTTEPGLADTWVFIDGKVRHNRLAINTTHGPQVVKIPLEITDQFLTLAATDGGNTFYYDWVMFGDPRIELEPIEKTTSQSTTKQ
jgi:hypothetical protein